MKNQKSEAEKRRFFLKQVLFETDEQWIPVQRFFLSLAMVLNNVYPMQMRKPKMA